MYFAAMSKQYSMYYVDKVVIVKGWNDSWLFQGRVYINQYVSTILQANQLMVNRNIRLKYTLWRENDMNLIVHSYKFIILIQNTFDISVVASSMK